MGALAGRRLLACCDYYGEAPTGCAERVALETLRRLAADGVSIRLLSASPDAPEGVTRTSDPAGFEVVRVRARDLSRLAGGQLSVAPSMFSLVRRELTAFAPEVVHTHSLHFPTSIAAAWHAPRAGVPLAVTVHVGDLSAIPARLRVPATVWEQTIGRFVLRRSDTVLAVSANVAEHCRTLGAAEDRIRIVPNGVDTERFAPPPFAPTEPLVVFVGRLIANKGPDVLLEAVADLVRTGRDAQLRFVGDGPLRVSLAERAEEVGCASVVSFTGAVSDPERHLREAQVMVRPSETEGMSLAVLEAMAAGVPVIASDIAANREVIDDGVDGLLVAPRRPDELAAALGSLLDTPEQREAMGVRAREKALTFGWDHTAERTESALATLVASR